MLYCVYISLLMGNHWLQIGGLFFLFTSHSVFLIKLPKWNHAWNSYRGQIQAGIGTMHHLKHLLTYKIDEGSHSDYCILKLLVSFIWGVIACFSSLTAPRYCLKSEKINFPNLDNLPWVKKNKIMKKIRMHVYGKIFSMIDSLKIM